MHISIRVVVDLKQQYIEPATQPIELHPTGDEPWLSYFFFFFLQKMDIS
jgi:hypothetical protein